MSKKDDIFDATLALMIEHGMQSVTLSKILERAGVGSGTLYNYFSSKDELLYELFQQIMQRMSDEIIAGYDNNADIRLRFNHLLSGYLDYIIRNYDENNFVSQYSHLLHKIKPEDCSTNDFTTALGETFKAGKEQKIILDMEVPILIQIVTGILISVINGYKSNKYELDDQKKKNILNICWNSVRA
ncbi:TetR/AcrR family transcriptional regulator [Enterococcus faecium]